MKFLVDAQLPRRLCAWLVARGHDAVHTLELPKGNRTTDAELIVVADRDSRILVTKDADFVHSRLVRGVPRRLWVIATGNIDNDALLDLLARTMPAVESALADASFVELGRDRLIVRE